MMKLVLKVELHDERIKQKAMKTASGISGVESVSVDMGSKKLTLIGDVDPIHLVSKLRKCCHTELVSVGPAKEEKKKEESAKPDQPKLPEPVMFYEAYSLYSYQMRPAQYTQYHCVQSFEQDNAGCVIC